MLTFLIVCFILGIIAAIFIAAGKVTKARIKGDYIECPTCGNEVLKTGTTQKCLKCRSTVVVRKDGNVVVK